MVKPRIYGKMLGKFGFHWGPGWQFGFHLGWIGGNVGVINQPNMGCGLSGPCSSEFWFRGFADSHGTKFLLFISLPIWVICRLSFHLEAIPWLRKRWCFFRDSQGNAYSVDSWLSFSVLICRRGSMVEAFHLDSQRLRFIWLLGCKKLQLKVMNSWKTMALWCEDLVRISHH